MCNFHLVKLMAEERWGGQKTKMHELRKNITVFLNVLSKIHIIIFFISWLNLFCYKVNS